MTGTAETPGAAKTKFGAIRVQARAIWIGPEGLHFRNQGERYWGWPVLTLRWRSAGSDLVESRSVYANMFDSSQDMAVLRSVYWDGESIKRAVWEDKHVELILPARFIALPVDRLKEWLFEFNGVKIQLEPTYKRDDAVPMRELRIQLDQATWAFELLWQMEDSEYAQLNRGWNSVWKELTEALTTAPAITDFEEVFRFVNPIVRYDFLAYDPNRHVPG